MGKQDRSGKDKERASRMKAEGTRRTTGACPNCHRPISIGGHALSIHLQNCGGNRGRS